MKATRRRFLAMLAAMPAARLLHALPAEPLPIPVAEVVKIQVPYVAAWRSAITFEYEVERLREYEFECFRYSIAAATGVPMDRVFLGDRPR